MATTTVLPGSDTRAPDVGDLGDWRTNLVVLPPEHVYGKTEFTNLEWRRLSDLRDRQGVRFVVRYTGGVQRDPVVSTRKSLMAARNDLREIVRVAAEMYHPHCDRRVTILAVDGAQAVTA